MGKDGLFSLNAIERDDHSWGMAKMAEGEGVKGREAGGGLTVLRICGGDGFG
jgi:hypothetical protein